MNNKETSNKITERSNFGVFFHHPKLRLLVKGLIISLPIIILTFILSLLLDLIFRLISPISYLISPGFGDPHWLIHICSLLIVLSIFFLIGLTTKNQKGRIYFSTFEKDFLNRLPLYTTIKELVKQFAGMKRVPFNQVVLIDPFDSGVLMTGFITEKVTDEIYTIFVPTAPNPTNGNIYHVPKCRVEFISTPAESAMRTIVGMGTGSTCLFEKKTQDILSEEGQNLLREGVDAVL